MAHGSHKTSKHGEKGDKRRKYHLGGPSCCGKKRQKASQGSKHRKGSR